VKNLVILIDRPGNSQKFQAITRELNRLDKSINAVVSYCELGPVPIKAQFPMMDLVHVYNFEGVVVSTDIYTTFVMNNMLCPTKKYFYVWDLEYLYQPYSMSMLKDIFSNKLIARNKTRFDVLKSTWHTPEFIMEEFSHENLQQLF
jgi:hypothetical protein